MLRTSFLAIALCCAMLACSSDDSTAPTGGELVPRFDESAADFFRMPWPSDHRTAADGTVDLSDFPDADFPMIAAIREAIEGKITGFSTMPVGYFELDRDPGDGALIGPAASLAPDAPVQLLAVSSEHCGERVPIEMQIAREEGKHIRPNVLEITPVPGFTLRQSVAYAFVVLRSFGQAVGSTTAQPPAFAAQLDGSAGGAIAESLEPLRSCASQAGLDLTSVAIATVFTVQDVLGPARALRDAVVDPAYSDAPTISGWAESTVYTGPAFTSYEATYETPIFQTGTSPYGQEGGDIEFVDGRPVIQRWEQVPMIITVPPGEGPFPVLLWIDGTGWSQWSHVNRPITKDILEQGFAVASYMPQFHGERATPGAEAELHTYNFSNPTAGRNVLRQQMADTSYFIRVLREAVPSQMDAPTLDTSRLVFGGQSQGAQNGALLAAVEPEIHAYVLNGLAAYLTITVLERKDLVDYETLLKVLLGVDVELDKYYPALQLLQLGADSVDQHNYAAGWSGWSAKEAGANLFVLNGYTDKTSHPIGMNAITIAGDLAPVDPPGWDVDPNGVWDREPETLPIGGNRTAADGQPHTLVTYLDPTEGHYTIQHRPEWRARAIQFLIDALAGTPTLKP